MTASAFRGLSGLCILLAVVLVTAMLVPQQAFAAIPGCAVGTYTNYGSGFDSDDFSLNNTSVNDDGHIFLETGNQAIDPQTIVIPFDQEVWISFFYERAGYKSTLGWMLKDDAVNADGSFKGWNNIPLEKKHALFSDVVDDKKGNKATTGGDGILDVYSKDSETKLADDYGFVVDGDGSVSPVDMRKSLGFFEAGTELVFYLGANQSNDSTDSNSFYYNISEWNPDTYNKCTPPAGDARWLDETGGIFYRTYELENPSSGNDCTMSRGLLDSDAIDRLFDNFGLTMSGDVDLDIIDGEEFPHVIAAAPDNDPNQWILSWEDLSGGGDMDYNDITFRLERKSGGEARLLNSRAIIPADAGAYYTAVTIEVYDQIPGGTCAGLTDIEYALAISKDENDKPEWVTVTEWDTVESFSFDAAGDKIVGSTVDPWTPGSPEQTYRTARIDFAGLDLSGRDLLWKATLKSDEETCVPKVIDTKLDASVATHAFLSRSSPIMAANVLYNSSYETPEMSWAKQKPRGHVKATRLYDPLDPSVTDTAALWDAGQVLADTSPADRNIYFPDISLTSVTDEIIATGDGVTTSFTGILDSAPILPTTLTIVEGIKTFVDVHTDVLQSDWGSGTINRFTGEYSIDFDTAPANNVKIKASYTYYVTDPVLEDFTTGNVSNSLLNLDNSTTVPSGYRYDLNGDGNFSEADGDWLVEWVRGYADGTAKKIEQEWKLGGIDHSTPALLTPPGNSKWYYGTDTSQDDRDSFTAFVADHEERDAVLFVGSRSGMLHAFEAGKFRSGDNPKTSIRENRGYFEWEDLDKDGDEEPNYGTGKELWAFIPANLLPKLKNNLLSGEDKAFVDASPALADVYIEVAKNKMEWRSVLLMAEGNGGDSVFCLDVTDPADPKLLWEFADPDLFRSRSSPAIGQIGRIMVEGNAKWAAFFVSGKSSDSSMYPSIYIIDIANGQLIDRVFLDDPGGLGVPSSVGAVPSGQPAIIDSDGNGFMDRLYIGLDKGQLYKVNLADNPDSSEYAIGYCIINKDFIDDDGDIDALNNPLPVTIPVDQRWHPIYASPTVVVDNLKTPEGEIDYNVRIFFGTGDSPYFDDDIDTGNTTYHFFAYNDKSSKGQCSDAEVQLDWFYALPAGARVFASAFASAGKIYFGTATSETENPCDGTNDGKLYEFNTTGYRLASPAAPETVIDTGDITTTPTVEDEHLFVQTSDGVLNVGGGGYNNETASGETGNLQIKSWKETE